VSYSLAHIFLIIFVQEEQQLNANSIDNQDMTHENALYGSLTIAEMGSCFSLLALFRLLEVWVRTGLKRNLHLTKYYLGVLALLVSAIPLVFSIACDIVLIKESSKEEEMSKEVKKALILKLIGASCIIILVIFFFILCISYAWSAYTSNASEKNRNKISPSSSILDEKEGLVEKSFRNTLVLLLVLGTLTLVRLLYALYIVIVVINMGPFWNISAYLILVVVDGIVLLLVAYLSNISRVKDLAVVSVAM
jgi:magnesium-transporting ATPase (P-type)